MVGEMVTVGELVAYILVVSAVTIILLYLSSRFTVKQIRRRKYNRKYGVYSRGMTAEEMAEAQLIQDYVDREQARTMTEFYPVSVATAENITKYVPYKIEGIHDILQEAPYSIEDLSKSMTRNSVPRTPKMVSKISAGSRVRSKLLRYREILLNERDELKIAKLNDALYIIISETKPLNIETFQFNPGLVFDYDRRSIFFNIN